MKQKIKLTLADEQPITGIKDDQVLWKLSLDNKAYPCESKAVQTYPDALDSIRLSEAIDGTVND